MADSAEARTAVAALIQSGPFQTREADDWNEDLRQAAILALGRIGPDAKAAIPTLRHIADSKDESPQCAADSVIALCRLAPDGTDLAKVAGAADQALAGAEILNSNSNVAHASSLTGRISFEGDVVTRSLLAGDGFDARTRVP